jgi:hypothetical protein
VKTRESVGRRRFLLGVFHKVGVEWWWEGKAEPRKFLGELLSDGEGRGVRAASAAWIWLAPKKWYPTLKFTLWPQKLAQAPTLAHHTLHICDLSLSTAHRLCNA